MLKRASIVFVAVMLAGCSRTAKSVVDDVGQAIGANNLKSIQYSGSGYIYAIGQSYQPTDRYSKFNLKSYTRLVDYEKGASREEDVRTQFEDPPRGGGVQPVIGERRAVAFLSGDSAWNIGANGSAAPTAAAVPERQVQLAITPHGWVKAAGAATNPTMESKTEDGKQMTVVSFTLKGKYKIDGYVNGQNLLEKVDTWLPNPVLGDMMVETTYSDYKDFNGVKFPTKIVQTQGGFPVLELNVSEVQPNAPANIDVPEVARGATPPPVKVDAQKLGDGAWFLAGGTHNSALVEFKDYVAVIEGPLDEDRSLAVIAEVKKLVPDKPIRYLINTHHHFDHSGGIRTYVAEGATIITHEMNKPFYEKTFAMSRTLMPDKLSQNPKEAKFETVTDKKVLTDGVRTLELYAVPTGHNAGLVIAYLPKEKVLIEPDLFNPPPPDAPPPAAVSPYTAGLQEKLQQLKLDVRIIAPLHGRIVPVAELRKALKKAT
jgi:glyoxylase-like metal-dependent hydrolase (beta-lactamase superfamily II)